MDTWAASTVSHSVSHNAIESVSLLDAVKRLEITLGNPQVQSFLKVKHPGISQDGRVRKWIPRGHNQPVIGNKALHSGKFYISGGSSNSSWQTWSISLTASRVSLYHGQQCGNRSYKMLLIAPDPWGYIDILSPQSQPNIALKSPGTMRIS